MKKLFTFVFNDGEVRALCVPTSFYIYGEDLSDRFMILHSHFNRAAFYFSVVGFTNDLIFFIPMGESPVYKVPLCGAYKVQVRKVLDHCFYYKGHRVSIRSRDFSSLSDCVIPLLDKGF